MPFKAPSKLKIAEILTLKMDHFSGGRPLSSSQNGFAGTFLYEGSVSSIPGLLNGSFYGEDALEAGGTFIGDDGSGNTVVGGFTAASLGSSPRNLSVYDLRADQLFYVPRSHFERRVYKDNSPGFSSATLDSNSQFSYRLSDDSYRVTGYEEAAGRFTPSDLVSSAGSEFDVYQLFPDIPRELAIYRPAHSGDVALTYSGFGVYSILYEDAFQYNYWRDWFGYGLDTLEGVLAGRTGTGIYTGVARGSGSSADGSRGFDVSGTSRFEIDFPSQGYSGWLRLSGEDVDSGSLVNFGQFDLVEGNGIYRNAFLAALEHDGLGVGEAQLRFYGPTGEELTGVFSIYMPDLRIAGATASVRD